MAVYSVCEVWSEVCVDWQAFTEIAVYNMRVFILASLQQSQNIKQNLSDSGYALGECNMFCCLFSWRVQYCVFLLVLGRVVWQIFVVLLGSYCQSVLFKLIVADRQQILMADLLGTQSCIVRDGFGAGLGQSVSISSTSMLLENGSSSPSSTSQESCLIGRLRVGLLRGDGELSEAEKKGLRSFSSIPTGLCASGSAWTHWVSVVSVCPLLAAQEQQVLAFLLLSSWAISQRSRATLKAWATVNVTAWAIFFFWQRNAWHSRVSLNWLWET